ncbi:MAG TPA: dockerin type I domain-containing protein [Patescibacteria group bacterium]|nr:dockerin type I domain-containing protein [Patescibacteria group bacterium]
MIKKILLAGLLLIILVGLPLTIYLTKEQQNTKIQAATGTTLSLIPQPGDDNSIEKTVGEPVLVDVMVNPQNNAIATLRMQITYDPTKLEPVAPYYTPDTYITLPVEGPIIKNGTVSITVTAGTDISKIITETKKAGTFSFKTITPTTENNPTELSFSSLTKAYSIGENDQSAENVLSSSQPAYITIHASSQSEPEPEPEVTLTDTPPDTETTPPTLTDTPTSTISPIENPLEGNEFVVTAFLHSIGNSGDNTNPTTHSLSNKSPQTQPRPFTLSIYNGQNDLVATKTALLLYDNTKGNFTGTISAETTLPEGDYIFKLKTESFLTKRIPGFTHTLPLTQVTLPTITLVAGDVNGDNLINILDYNSIMGCYSDFEPPANCNETMAKLTDLNDDGHVNQIDYNLFIREITVQLGE